MLFTQPARGRGWDPFSEMRRLQTEMNRLFEGAGAYPAARAYPAVNLWLGDNSVAVTAELPGLTQDDVDLAIREDTLTIQGERKVAENGNQAAWHRRERPAGSFSRTVELPFRVDPDRVQARFTHGVLKVEMQRPETDKPRKIEIKAS